MGFSLRFLRKILYKHCAVVNSDLWAGPKPQTICIETVVLEIRYLGEAEVVFTCPINYSDFPFHVATCRLRVTSFTSVNTSMQVRDNRLCSPILYWPHLHAVPQQPFSVASRTGDVKSFLGVNPMCQNDFLCNQMNILSSVSAFRWS